MALLAATINKTLQRSACWRSTIDSHSSQVQTQPQKPSFHLVTTLLATFSGYFWFLVAETSSSSWGYTEWEELPGEPGNPQKKPSAPHTPTVTPVVSGRSWWREREILLWGYARPHLTPTQKASFVWSVCSFHWEFQKKGKDTLWQAVTSQKSGCI